MPTNVALHQQPLPNTEVDNRRVVNTTNVMSDVSWNEDAERELLSSTKWIFLAQVIGGKMTGIVMASIKEGAKEMGGLRRFASLNFIKALQNLEQIPPSSRPSSTRIATT
jgi:hypothetical protein